MGAVFCDDPTAHGPHQAPTDTGRCPGRGLPSHLDQRALMDDDVVEANGVCVSCGRTSDRDAGKDCEQPEYHDGPPPAPEPALQGADLVAHLQRERASLQDQVRYASQLLAVLCLRQEDRRLVVAPDELEAVDGTTLTTYRQANGVLIYEVRS